MALIKEVVTVSNKFSLYRTIVTDFLFTWIIKYRYDMYAREQIFVIEFQTCVLPVYMSMYDHNVFIST